MSHLTVDLFQGAGQQAQAGAGDGHGHDGRSVAQFKSRRVLVVTVFPALIKTCGYEDEDDDDAAADDDAADDD